ncbi:MAG: flagellar assembly protein FliW [Planctomycetota bacterium]|jgi:flagellar assembly factor FliW
MQIQSTRFGKLEVSHADMLLMPNGVIGFETCRHWVLLATEETEEVAWLQAVALPSVALPVISPRRFLPNYRLNVHRRSLELLQLHSRDQVFVLSVVSRNENSLTTNLKSPIILNSTRRLALQVVVSDDQPLAHPLALVDGHRIRTAA